VEQLDLGEFPKCTKLDLMSKEEIMEKYTDLESEYLRALGEIYKLKYQNLTDSQLKLVLTEQLSQMRKDKFGSSSERYKKPEKKKSDPPVPPKPRIKKPSERYPYIPVREVVIKSGSVPACNECGEVMRETSMTEDSEQLTVIPKKYEITLQKRVKYVCTCESCIVTAEAPARIIPGSTYSDEMILDVALSKYCDLIPIERYVAMAERNGLFDLPPHSLIELTHQYAEFLKPIYALLKQGAMDARVLCADETPHRMLEGSNKKKWFLWGFSTSIHCFLECHDTRSGDVASDMLVNSKCEILMSDVYSGYGKAVRISNIKRKEVKNPLIIQQAHCNAHARRYFFKAHETGNYPESTFYLDHYHEIYQLNDEAKGKPPPEILALRSQMKFRFEAMKTMAESELMQYPRDNLYAKALRYFLGNYEGLTRFLTDAEIPIDNNAQESMFRSPVVGRKTWYGTHSKLGAKTAAILFSIVETCKLNGVNPREYFKQVTEHLLQGNQPYTPNQFKIQEDERARSKTTLPATQP